MSDTNATDKTALYEQLGLFYLGGEIGGAAPPTERPYLLKSRDLTTHAVIVGMTGSGKTGLGAVLLEEAAIDGIPAIVIDPKGDLTNLGLTFPALDAASFAPWMTDGEDAAVVADRWRRGIGEWHQAPARIGAFASAVERAIYTPGSKAGRPLSILQSFNAPQAGDAAHTVDADEAQRARAVSLSSSLLSLAGIEGDPVTSPEHVLLSNIFLHLWSTSPTVDLGELLAHVQNPPFARLGLMATDSVAPPALRTSLAMRLNTAFASPALRGFLEGEPLDIGGMLYTPEGKARLAIVTLSHLSDELRMFFVTLLLGEILAWARAQPGTSSLRALVYIDEVAGYVPPVAQPPSKAPLMTLMKQARAFGVGCVLATQNPVDVDYKALSNAGLWLLGRLQTERDKARVLDGLEGSSGANGGAFDRAAIDSALSSLPKRSFYAHNVHASSPTTFSTRFALSYLRGPLTSAEIQRLSASLSTHTAPSTTTTTTTTTLSASPSPAAKATPPAATTTTSTAPPLPRQAAQRFVAAEGFLAPRVFGELTVGYKHTKTKTDIVVRRRVVIPVVDDHADFDAIADASADSDSWSTTAPPSATFASLPPLFSAEKTWVSAEKNLVTAVVRDMPLVLLSSPATGVVSRPGEAKGAFVQRVAQRARELRDDEVEKLKSTWQTKIARAETALKRAEEKHRSLDQRQSAQTMNATVDIGVSVLGALFGSRRSVASAAGRAAKSASRRMASGESIKAAEDAVTDARNALTQLQVDAEAAFDAVHERVTKAAADLEELRIPAKKADVDVDAIGVLWAP
jgi:hypothetical protein